MNTIAQASLRILIVGRASDGYLGVEAALKLKSDLVVTDIKLACLDRIATTQ